MIKPSQLIREGITEACKWYELCGQKGSYVDLRSMELNPSQSLTESHRREFLVDQLRHKRSRLVTNMRTTSVGRRDGNLLVYYPDLTLSDGAGELASEGLFDTDNEPPWDTWIFFGMDFNVRDAQDYGSFLLSWIPNDFSDRANRGILMNPEKYLEWAKESNHPVIKEVEMALR